MNSVVTRYRHNPGAVPALEELRLQGEQGLQIETHLFARARRTIRDCLVTNARATHNQRNIAPSCETNSSLAATTLLIRSLLRRFTILH